MTRRGRRNGARFLAVAILLGGLVLAFTGTDAGADDSGATLTGHGWWWTIATPPPLPPPPAPPTVKPGQLYIAGDPGGKASYAAVRYAIAPGQVISTLTLTVGANGDQGGSSAVLLACQSGSSWTSTDAGSAQNAPKVEADKCINGQRATDGKTWAFPVGTLQLGTVLDVALVPGTDPNTKQGSVFSLTFDAPADTALATAPGTLAPPTTPPFVPVTSPAGAGAGAPSGSTGGTSFHAPPAVATATPALPATQLGETATAPAKQAASQPALDASTATPAAARKDRNRVPGFIVLGVAAAVGLYAWREDNAMKAAAPLGTSEPTPGGLGRFHRAREGQPPALT
jgi:hypothetical protein